jgi:hypothetical protein
MISAGGATLLQVLGAQGGITGDPKGIHAYMKTWFDTLRAGTDPQGMKRQMGWQPDNSFVLGSDQFMPDGAIVKCTLSKDLKTYEPGHVPIGTLEDQVELIDRLYNRPGMEAYQFVLASSLGSILLPMVHKGSIGVPISIWETDGGKGKTTVCKASIGLWGDPDAQGQEAHAHRTTEYAMYAMVGIRRHLPVLVDEVTTWRDPDKIAEFAYAYSSGKAKLQGRAEGGIRDNSHQDWQNFLYLTSNKSLVSLMSATIPNCGPQVARVFEIQFPKVILSANDGKYVNQLWSNSGHIGRKFLKFVVRHREAVQDALNIRLEHYRAKVDKDTDARYWLMTAACTDVAASIAVRMGLFRFDMAAFTDWTENQVRIMRGDQKLSVEDLEEQMSRMVSDLVGGVLVTDTFPQRGQKGCLIDPIFTPPKYRQIIGRHVTKTDDLYLTVAAIRRWCATNQVEYRQLRDWAAATNKLVAHDARLYLTSGTSLGRTAQSRCWHLKTTFVHCAWTSPEEAIEAELDKHPELTAWL